MVQPSKKSEFEFREKLESWVEGIFETIAGYIRTVYFFNFRFVLHPREGAKQLEVEATESVSLTQPATFMIVSYFLMAYLVKGVDFSDPVFAFNLSKQLDVLGVLEAAKSLDVEKVMLGISPRSACFSSFAIFLTASCICFESRLIRKSFAEDILTC